MSSSSSSSTPTSTSSPSSLTPTEPVKVIIDTDIGVDDVMAILVALLDPNVDVLALTCVSGNVHLDHVTKSAGILLDLVQQKDIPFFAGASKPLVGPWIPPSWDGHGTNGLGDVEIEASSLQPQSECSAAAIARLVKENPDVKLIALGPLTNVALAACIDPSICDILGRDNFYFMGGAHLGQGNSSYAAEFNLMTDPEAARICFERFQRLTMISWEMTELMPFPWGWWDSHIKESPSPSAKFLATITTKYEDMVRPDLEPLIICDVIAMVALLRPETVTKSKQLVGTVELAGTHTRGATVFDWNSTRSPDANKNVNLILDMDIGAMLSYFETLF